MKRLRLFLRLLAFLILLLPFAGAVAAYFAFDRHPSIDRAAELSPGNIERAKRVLDANDPRRMRVGTMQRITVSAADLDLAANYLMHRATDGSARVDLKNDRAHVTTSVRVPGAPLTIFVNLDAIVRRGDPFPAVERLRVGQLAIPQWVVDRMVSTVVARAFDAQDRDLFRTVVKSVEFRDEEVALTYEWHADLADRFRTALVTPEDQERVRLYHQRLVEATQALAAPAVSLVDLLPPLFTLALERSRSGDPVAENRAALLVLTAYVNGRSLVPVFPDARKWPRLRSHEVTLNRRNDFPKHFIISAALSANAGGPLADAVGLYKEIADSRGGSGFSFNDIAADRAGSRLGELAEHPDTARRLQARLAATLTERAVMPETSDLPEFMPEPEFKRRFGGVGEPAYNRMMADIERRIAALPIFN